MTVEAVHRGRPSRSLPYFAAGPPGLPQSIRNPVVVLGGSSVEVGDGVTVLVTVRGAGVLVRVMTSGSGELPGTVTVTGPTERDVEVGDGVVPTS